MIGRIMLLKLLHRKRKQRHIRDNRVVTQSSKTYEEIHVKKEVIDELTCRVCLKDGNIPIFGGDDAADISNEILTFADIHVSCDDSFPKYLCQGCHSLLQGAILFRKTAQATDENLHQTSLINLDDDIDLNIANEDKDNVENTDNDCIENNHYVDQNPQGGYGSPHDKCYYCKKCELSFITYIEYVEHRLSAEHENKKHICPVCKKSYNHLYIKRHLLLHEQEPLYMCDVCGKKFIVKGNMERHREIHNFDFSFKCNLCPYKGRFKESLKRHMFVHTGEKPHQCSQCPYRCANISNLSRHMVIHKDPAFKCDSCGRGYHTKKDLEVHIKIKHMGVKEHDCNVCGKEFGYRRQLVKHLIKVHKRQKMRTGRVPLYLQVEEREGGSPLE